MLNKWIKNRRLFERLRDPNRVSDARRVGAALVNKLEADIGLAMDICNEIQ